MKKVLVITYFSPPCCAIGVHRSLRFIKNLPQYNWTPTVLTIKENYYEDYYKMDSSLMEKIPKEVEIFRTKVSKPFLSLIKVRNRIITKENHKEPSDRKSERKCTVWQHIKDWISDLLTLPDVQIGWFPYAICSGIKLIKQKKIDLIYAVGPPWTTHLIGLFLKYVTKKPLVVDFRDPWIQNPWRRKYSTLRLIIEKFMEKKVIKSADRVVANTNSLRDDFLKRYNLDSIKCTTITNGFDSDDFREIESSTFSRDSKIFTITHTGTFYNERNPITFLQAVANLVLEGKIPKDEIRINLIGVIDIEGFQIEEFLEKIGIKDIVHLTNDYIPHTKCLEYLFNSDILLLIQPATALQVPGKVFEYIRIGKPIFTLAIEGETANLIRGEGIGVIVDPDNIERIKEEFYNLYMKFKTGKLFINLNSNVIEKYNGAKLTKELAQVFSEVS
ncbi:MAG: glycosyltransferase [Nitrospirota bacterium]